MSDKTKKFYDKAYLEEDNIFGSRPVEIVEKIPRHASSGKALDIGAGDGRNALFLATEGFDVVAVDISESAVGKIKEKADKLDLKVEARISDVLKDGIQGSFDVIISSFLFHHLPREKGRELIGNMKEHTKEGGLNAIAAFTSEGDFYTLPNQKKQFYPRPGEIRDIYADWEVIESYEKESRTRKKDEAGNHMKNLSSFLLARKSV